jgi:nitrite reductase/ring-hydroxylating ferredoxin subunit
MTEWVAVAKVDELPEGDMIGATIEGIDVLVANLGGHYRAIGSEYTHAGCALGGKLDAEEGVVTCACGGPSRQQRRRRPRARRRC